nr:O-antigen ligase family protein [Pseudarthrobacter oxydans]
MVVVIFFLLPFSEAMPAWASAAWTSLVFAMILGCAAAGRGRKPVGYILWILAAYLAVIGVVTSSGAADSMRGHLIIGVQVLIFIAVAPFVARWLAEVDGLSGKAVGAFLIGQSVSATAGLAQAAGVTTLGFKAVNGRASGLASHPNILGLLAGVAVVIFLYLLFKTERRNLPLLTGLVLNIGALFASGSVSALIACGVGVILFMLAARISLRVPLLLAIVATAALWLMDQLDRAGLIRSPARRFAQVTGQTSDKSTLDIRQNTYAYAWEGIRADPIFGRGLDSASGATYDHITLTHNLLLRTWFQGGLGLGLAAMLIVAAIASVIVLAVVRRRDAATVGVLAVLIGFSMTSAALQQGYFWLLLLGAWGLLSQPVGDSRHRLLGGERRLRATTYGRRM